MRISIAQARPKETFSTKHLRESPALKNITKRETRKNTKTTTEKNNKNERKNRKEKKKQKQKTIRKIPKSGILILICWHIKCQKLWQKEIGTRQATRCYATSARSPVSASMSMCETRRRIGWTLRYRGGGLLQIPREYIKSCIHIRSTKADSNGLCINSAYQT